MSKWSKVFKKERIFPNRSLKHQFFLYDPKFYQLM